jgi:hypothetical protein
MRVDREADDFVLAIVSQIKWASSEVRRPKSPLGPSVSFLTALFHGGEGEIPPGAWRAFLLNADS